MKTKLANYGVLLVVVLLVSVGQVVAEAMPSPTIQWQKSFGGSYGNYFQDLQQTTDGGYILGGRSDSGVSRNKTSPNYGNDDYWVVKIDVNGNKLWDKSFGGSGEDRLYSLQQTTDGGYILGGYSSSGVSGNKTSVNYGNEDYWVVKIDVSGNKLWEQSFGGSNPDYLDSLQQTSDGGYILGGSSTSSVSGNKTSANYGNWDYWIIKIDANGNKLWERSFGGSSRDYLLSLQQTSDGGYILGGYSDSSVSGNKIVLSYGSRDGWVIKLDVDGNKIWERSFGGSSDDRIMGLQQTSDGGYILGGFSYSSVSGNKTSVNYGYQDYWVVRLDVNGNKLWDESFGGNGDDWFYSLQQTTDGGYILGGRSGSGVSGNKISVNYGYQDYWVVRLDANGNKLWEQSFGGSGHDGLLSFKQTSDRGYILGGYSDSVVSGNKTSTKCGSVDYWVIKLEEWFTPFANVSPVTQETYSCSIAKQPGKDSLVIVTHGWIRKEIGQTSPPDPGWVDDMANQIRDNIANQGLNNWQVETFKWKEKAWLGIFDALVREIVLDNAEKEGGNLGDCVGSQGWSHVHLIGHSAGAAVIQAATLNIKSANINTVVHTTFLDPYVGGTYGGRSRYGFTANWSDNYFAFDLDTFDNIAEPTAGKIDNAYNVEVTWLDPNKYGISAYQSNDRGGVEQCMRTVTSHQWPHGFYANTIPPSVQQSSQGFGFPLSKEGGGWDFTLANYLTYTDPIYVLGNPDAPCFTVGGTLDYSTPFWSINLNQIPSVTSITGSVENNGTSLILSGTGGAQLRPAKTPPANASDASSTPAWLATVLAVTNKINSVSFNAQFTSTNGSEGVLSVYWNTNQIGTIDERVVVSGLRHYTYSLAQTITNGTHTLGFRLDSFTAATSSILVTNVALSFVGITDPFGLSVTGKDTNGFVKFQLTGPSGFNYSVETSTNLVDWQMMAVLINTNGVVPFVDMQSTNSPAKFYRAVEY